MKAIILEEAGTVENLKLKVIEKPIAGKNEVLVEVRGISVNPVDYKIRTEEQGITMMYGDQRPVILGWDIAGIVVATGEKANKFKVGDKVFGMVNFPGAGKAYAEFVASPESHLSLMPEHASFQEAAASTLAALTALQAMEGRVKKGDRVFIHAGSGGVGHFAIQIAKSMGAYVIASSSMKNRDFILSLGADEHIDYHTQKIEEELSEIAFVLDPFGGEVLLNSLKIMNPGASLVSLAIFEVPEDVKVEADEQGVQVIPLMVNSNGSDMETLKGLLDSGAVKPHISKTFAFADMAGAHQELESGRTVGKVVVTL